MTTAEAMIACNDINAALAFYVDRLGFRVDSIFPAEAPEVAVLRGYGLRLRLDPAAPAGPAALRISCSDLEAMGGPARLTAPDGTTVDIVDADPPLALPPVTPIFELQRASRDANWSVGRAGMRYRDLLPQRQGGRFVASHIHIPNAGPVPDYVHFHKVRFQMIYCYRGWVRLVYEDQGEPFIMSAGDCVLQPPRIRHRVLESSDGLEVIEIGCPALHETFADPELSLPTVTLAPLRDFGGQRYAFHQASSAVRESASDSFERRRFGFTEATNGLAEASVLRAAPSAAAPMNRCHDGEFLFIFVLEGSVTLHRSGSPDEPLTSGDSFAMPPNENFHLAGRSCRPRIARGRPAARSVDKPPRAVKAAGPWAPLRGRLFRWLWIAGLVSNVGTFMHIVAAGWAITSLSDSPAIVSLVQTAWTVPGFLLALHAGALADVLDRRKLILLTQFVALIVAAALGVIEVTDRLTIVVLLFGTFALSMALTVSAPAFTALTPDLVAPDLLAPAFGLDSISRNIAQSLGPAIAGTVIALGGPGAVFVLNAVSFIGILIVLYCYRPVVARVPAQQQIGAALREGVKYFTEGALASAIGRPAGDHDGCKCIGDGVAPSAGSHSVTRRRRTNSVCCRQHSGWARCWRCGSCLGFNPVRARTKLCSRARSSGRSGQARWPAPTKSWSRSSV